MYLAVYVELGGWVVECGALRALRYGLHVGGGGGGGGGGLDK